MKIPKSGRAINALKPDLSFRDFLPLIWMSLLVGILTAITFLSEQNGIHHGFLHEGMRYFMGFFFLVFGALKIIRLKKFSEAYAVYDILAKRSRIYAYTYPFIELLLAVLYLCAYMQVTTSIFTVILMLVSAWGVWRELRKDTYIPCACLGTVFSVPMTHVTLIEDLLMAGMALAMLGTLI